MQAAAAVAALLLLLLLSPIAVARLTAISDGNIISAVSEWTTSPTTATTMYGDIGGRNVASMSNLFNNKPTFNAEIGGWNTSSVSNMYGMFRDSAFNANIGRWYAYHEHYGS